MDEAKRRMRERMREVLSSLEPRGRENASAQIVPRVFDWACWKEARTVLFYMPRWDEPDLRALMTVGLEAGKRCCLPRYRSDTQTYGAAAFVDLEGDLRLGAYHILEPSPSCSSVEVDEIDLTFVPGLAFDRAGCRLGRGKGFYDRLLSGGSGVRCGIVFDQQVVEAVPFGLLDQKMDWIITPATRTQMGARGVAS